jgi:uncharacterized integral membrane protein
MMNKYDHERGVFALYTDLQSVNLAKELLKNNNYSESKVLLLESFNDRNNKITSKDFVYKQKTSLQLGALVGGTTGFFIFGFIEIVFNLNPTLLPLYGFNSSWPMLVLPVKAFLGVLTGATMGALIGVGITQSPAKRYGFYLKEGGVVLVVHTTGQKETEEITQLLARAKAEDINVLKKSEIWQTILPERNRLLGLITTSKPLQSLTPY